MKSDLMMRRVVTRAIASGENAESQMQEERAMSLVLETAGHLGANERSHDHEIRMLIRAALQPDSQ